MSRPFEGTDQPVPAKKKPIVLEDLTAAQQPRIGADLGQATEPPGYYSYSLSLIPAGVLESLDSIISRP